MYSYLQEQKITAWNSPVPGHQLQAFRTNENVDIDVTGRVFQHQGKALVFLKFLNTHNKKPAFVTPLAGAFNGEDINYCPDSATQPFIDSCTEHGIHGFTTEARIDSIYETKKCYTSTTPLIQYDVWTGFFFYDLEGKSYEQNKDTIVAKVKKCVDIFNQHQNDLFLFNARFNYVDVYLVSGEANHLLSQVPVNQCYLLLIEFLNFFNISTENGLREHYHQFVFGFEPEPDTDEFIYKAEKHSMKNLIYDYFPKYY